MRSRLRWRTVSAGGRLALQGADLAGQRRRQASLLQVARPTLLVFGAKMIEPGDQLGEPPLGLGHRRAISAVMLFGLADGLGRVVQLLLQVVGPGGQRQEVAAMAGDFLLQVGGRGFARARWSIPGRRSARGWRRCCGSAWRMPR